jgi:hypothetical protein
VHDGQWVTRDGNEGHVLTTDGRNSHVLWHTGTLTGQVTLHSNAEFGDQPVKGHIEASLDDSLDVGTLAVTSARQAYDEAGPQGVLEQMSFYGQLGMLSDVADEAYALLTTRVRNSPYIRSVTAQLDEDEAEAVVHAASAALLHDLLVPEE